MVSGTTHFYRGAKNKLRMNPLQLQVALLPGLLHTDNTGNRGAVVIDTLRFTTTAAQALAAGCHSIWVAGTVQQALNLSGDSSEKNRSLLCGERNCRPIAGFDLGNSPLEYTPQRVKDRKLIFTTTNGTLAVQATSDFQHCLLGSLVNSRAVARRILDLRIQDWHFIGAGTDGEVAGEDILAAGAIIQRLVELTKHQVRLVNDAAMLALQLWEQSTRQFPDLAGLLSSFSGGRNLVDAGYGKDILFASQVDSLDIVPSRFGHQACFVI